MKGKAEKLNPLSFESDTIITKDFHCFTSRFGGLHEYDVIKWF